MAVRPLFDTSWVYDLLPSPGSVLPNQLAQPALLATILNDINKIAALFPKGPPVIALPSLHGALLRVKIQSKGNLSVVAHSATHPLSRFAGHGALSATAVRRAAASAALHGHGALVNTPPATRTAALHAHGVLSKTATAKFTLIAALPAAAALSASAGGGIFSRTAALPGHGVLSATTLQPNGPSGSWVLQFQDTFPGSTLDVTKWNSTWMSGGTQNGVTTSAANVAVSGGNLILTLADATHGASINTDPTQGANPGYQLNIGVVEARINFPGNGTNLYNWVGWYTTGYNSPTTATIDVAEVLSPGTLQSHYDYSGGTPELFNAGYLPGWHTYTLQRSGVPGNGQVQVWIDGVLKGTQTTYDAQAPHMLVLTVGTGQGPAGYGSTGQVLVDYVRAWTSVATTRAVPLPATGVLSGTAKSTEFILACALPAHGTLSSAVSVYFARSAALPAHGALSAIAAHLIPLPAHAALSGTVKPKLSDALKGHGALSATAHSSKFVESAALAGHGTLFIVASAGNAYPSAGIWTTGGSVTDTYQVFSDLPACFEPSYHAAPITTFTNGDGSGLTSITTPYGQGFQVVCTDNNVAIWDSNDKDILMHGVSPGNDILGSVAQWVIPMYYPSQTWPSDFWSGTHWELHTTANQAHQVGIDTTQHGTPTAPVWRFFFQSGSNGTSGSSFYGPTIVLNTWHIVVMQVYWTESGSGYANFYVDGVQYGNFTGQTYFASFGNPYVQWGIYSLGPGSVSPGLTNTLRYGPVIRTQYASLGS